MKMRLSVLSLAMFGAMAIQAPVMAEVVEWGEFKVIIETNATNRKCVCCIDFDLDEDDQGNVFLDAVSDQWLPAIPAIGVLWEF